MTKQSVSQGVQRAAIGEAHPLPGWPPLAALRGEIDRLFDDFGTGLWRSPRAARRDRGGMLWTDAALAPALEVVDRDTHYEIKAELPGLSPADIELALDAGMLTISGERSEEMRDEKDDYLLSERHYGAFRRSLRLPPGTDADKIAAELAQGVLTISVPKTEQARISARKIAIRGQ